MPVNNDYMLLHFLRKSFCYSGSLLGVLDLAPGPETIHQDIG